MGPHTKARIYPAISIFESLVQEGCSREQAAQVIYNFFDIFAAKGARMIQMMQAFNPLIIMLKMICTSI